MFTDYINGSETSKQGDVSHRDVERAVVAEEIIVNSVNGFSAPPISVKLQQHISAHCIIT